MIPTDRWVSRNMLSCHQDLMEELRHLDSCRSGEARSCKSYGMPCQRLLLTVGPKYKDLTFQAMPMPSHFQLFRIDFL